MSNFTTPSAEEIKNSGQYHMVNSYTEGSERVNSPGADYSIGDPVVKKIKKNGETIFVVEQKMRHIGGTNDEFLIEPKGNQFTISRNGANPMTLSMGQSQKLIQNGIGKDGATLAVVNYYTRIDEYKKEKKKSDKWITSLSFGLLGVIIILFPILAKNCGMKLDGIEGCAPKKDPNSTEELNPSDYSEEITTIINMYYNKILDSFIPGMIIRERADAVDGKNYDDKLLGKGGSYNKLVNEGIVDPGNDFLDKYYNLKAITNPTFQDLMNAIQLLQEFSLLCNSLQNEIEAHINSNEQVLSAGIRGESYNNERRILDQQLQDVNGIIQLLKSTLKDSKKVLDIIEGIKEGRITPTIINNGIMIVGTDSEGKSINEIIPLVSLAQNMENSDPTVGGR